MSLEPPYLFVYGTLRSDAGHPMHDELARHFEPVGDARISAVLYDMGHYPGIVRGDGDVVGQLFKWRGSEEPFAKLDHYEGWEYERRTIEARMADGQTYLAWCYELLEVPEVPVVESGDWIVHQSSGRR